MFARVISLLGSVVLAATGCGKDSAPDPGSGPDAGADGPAGPTTFQETVLTLVSHLTIHPADGNVPEAAVLEITARDGTTPVMTDLWLYTLDPGGAPLPLIKFTATAARKNPGLFLPATVGGQASTLVPADDGRRNGLLSNALRGTRQQGAFVSSVDGTVEVTLAEVPTTPILIVAAIEDQRYAGAAVINPDGSPGTVPPGADAPQTHIRRSFTGEVVPLLSDHCSRCHNATHANHAGIYKVTGTRDELVNDNFALSEDAIDCRAANPGGGPALDQCIAAITKAEFLVEPGVPALSGLLTRARPDEAGGSSATGLTWWGSRGVRYNATYGDRRMPSTTESTDPADWAMNLPTDFDLDPAAFQVLYDWVAQGAPP